MDPSQIIPQLEHQRNRAKGETDSVLQSFPASPLPHTMLLSFKSYTYTTLGEYGVLKPLNQIGNRTSSNVEVRGTSHIELPFPTQLTDNQGLQVGDYERNLLAANVADRLKPILETGSTQTIGETLNKLGAQGSRALDGIISAIANPGDSSSAAASAISGFVKEALGTSTANVASGAQYLLRSKLDAVLGGEVSRTLDNVTGQTVNPRSTLAFTGVDLKSHQFSWELYPSNETDSKIIRNIIQTIKRNALPSVQDLPGISRAFLKYPSVVDMYLLGIDEGYWMKFKPCMISNVSVDYGGGGLVSIIKGGKPAAVNLSLSLTELEIWTEEDYTGSAAESLPGNTSFNNGLPVDSSTTGGPQ
jgi:hypothetical protein